MTYKACTLGDLLSLIYLLPAPGHTAISHLPQLPIAPGHLLWQSPLLEPTNPHPALRWVSLPQKSLWPLGRSFLLPAPSELSTVASDFGLCDAVISTHLPQKKLNQKKQTLAFYLIIDLHLRFFKKTPIKAQYMALQLVPLPFLGKTAPHSEMMSCPFFYEMIMHKCFFAEYDYLVK